MLVDSEILDLGTEREVFGSATPSRESHVQLPRRALDSDVISACLAVRLLATLALPVQTPTIRRRLQSFTSVAL